MTGLRLIDAVAVAALTLLFLKAASWLVDAPQPQASIAGVQSASLLDVETTGSSSPAPKKEEPPPPPEPEKPKYPAFDPVPPPASKTEKEILDRLGNRREEIQQRAKEIDMRERLLDNAEKKLETRLNELKSVEEKGEGAKKSEQESAGMRNLVTMYESMKPKDAAKVFDRLSLDILVPVVLQMNPRKMAEVLAVMTPEAAEKLTVSLALRARGTVPQQALKAPLPASELQGIE